ncbi:hypothetical protein BC829DRAFT_19087 [Chytridium lagenaria]|nr:hypothetical protein BC829DRAFT_19087 [Chytridium lagenaria]
MCRICFGGSEDEEVLGRLISPCKCKGSMEHVHTMCLKGWRSKMFRPGDALAINMCLYEYNLTQGTWVQLLQSKVFAMAFTTFLFLFTIYISGFATKLLLINLCIIYDHIYAGNPHLGSIFDHPWGTSNTLLDTILFPHLNPNNIDIYAFDLQAL